MTRHGVGVFSSNYALYGDMSRRVMDTLGTFTPEFEIYSIDEAFLNFAGFERRGLAEYAREMRATVRRDTGSRYRSASARPRRSPRSPIIWRKPT